MSAKPVRATSGLLSIGQVLQRLSSEFEDLSPSKIRFLEDQGLVTPDRTQSGYRKFSSDHVERIRTILTLQRDHYLPLKVIRAYLDDVDAGRQPQLPGGNIEVSGVSILSTELKLSRAELLEATVASRRLLLDAQQAQMVPSAEPYSENTVSVLKALVSLAEYGIEPRHLRGMRASAAREAALIEQAVRPLAGRRHANAQAEAVTTASELATHIQSIREILMQGALGSLSQ